MTEAEWMAEKGDAASLLVNFCSGGPLCGRDRDLAAAGRDKFRLLICACCRRIWPLLADPRSRAAVEVAERFVDGEAGEEELRVACRAAEDAFEEIQAGQMTGSSSAAGSAVSAAIPLGAIVAGHFGIGENLEWFGIADEGLHGEKAAENAIRCDLVRDIYGNPFRAAPVIGSNWLTSTVLALARGIYEERAFDRMPILADALQDAGCDNEDILNHCRGKGPTRSRML